jgi:hypothetical protein
LTPVATPVVTSISMVPKRVEPSAKVPLASKMVTVSAEARIAPSERRTAGSSTASRLFLLRESRDIKPLSWFSEFGFVVLVLIEIARHLWKFGWWLGGRRAARRRMCLTLVPRLDTPSTGCEVNSVSFTVTIEKRLLTRQLYRSWPLLSPHNCQPSCQDCLGMSLYRLGNCHRSQQYRPLLPYRAPSATYSCASGGVEEARSTTEPRVKLRLP